MNDSYSISPFHWSSGAKTDRGHVRKVNEDNFLELPEKGLWVVADGMGGYEAGDISSQAITDALKNLEQVPSPLSAFVDDIESRLTEVNKDLHERTLKHSRVIGSTVVALLALEKHCIVMWAGDSRAYRYRADKLKQLTQDHSQIEELIEKGVLSPKEIEHYPSNVITRAVGAKAELILDLDINTMQKGDIFLLCSDGLYREISEKEMSKHLSQIPKKSCQEIAEALVNLVLEGQAKDNITAIVIYAQS